MTEFIEATLRLSFFFGVFAIMALWELMAPRRILTVRKIPRWGSNLGLVVFNTVLLRLFVPLNAVATAIAAEAGGWGLLNLTTWPPWLELLIAVMILDLAVFLQHVMFHFVPLLWRLHLVHHADLDIDVSTGLRFHTLEILLSAFIKMAVIAVLGPSAVAVVAFEILLNATSMFSHSNIRLPGPMDQVLRLVIVTPDMHRVHHSIVSSEMNSNFGFNLPWWDYLMRTYRSQPELGHERMTIGVSYLRDESHVDRLPGILVIPFLKQPERTRHDEPPDKSVDGGAGRTDGGPSN